MEYIQAILFTFKDILGETGNTDLFYLFSLVVLLYYAWCRRDRIEFVIKASTPIAIVCIIMATFYPQISILRVGVFLSKTILNITLLLFVAYNCRKWKLTKFVRSVTWIYAIETVIAVCLPNSCFWVNEKFSQETGKIARLKLFYSSAGTLAFVCGFLLIVTVYQIITEEIVWHQVLSLSVFSIDIYLSYGTSGLACTVVAVIFLLFLEYKYKFRHNKKFLVITVGSFMCLIVACINSAIYQIRTKTMIDGVDYMLNVKLLEPLNKIGNVLRKTHYLGVGFGNANMAYALNVQNANYAHPNSFLRIIAEGGLFGITLVVILIITLLYCGFKYGSIIDKSLCIYVIAYQFVGGYFTNPIYYYIYGLILGGCINNIIRTTGNTKIKLFMPTHNDSLYLAQIGHKRIPSREGGVEIVVEELSKRIVKRGHKVDAYNRKGNHISGAQYNLVDYDTIKEYEGINIIRIPTVNKKGFAALIYSFIASVYVTTKKYDVIHYHAEGPCAFIWIPSLLGIRTIVTIHGLDWLRIDKWGTLASLFIKFGERMAVECADDIIVLSKHVQQYFKITYNRKTVFIPNGVNRPKRVKANSIKNKWGLENNSYILLLARLTSEKGFHYAIDAFRSIDTDKKMVISGGASDSNDYVQKLKDLAGDDERIVFTGFVQGEDLDELYSNAYIYCLPSDLEGMPISLLEAMSYGNCCLVSDIPECASIVGRYGRTFQQGNVQDLTKELKDLIEHPEVVEEYRNKSSDYVCEKYNWDDVVDRTIKLYMGN